MRRLLLIVLVGLASACEHNTAPVAGLLNVRLTTPNSGSDAAMLVNITGPAALTSVSVPSGLRLFAQPLPFVKVNSFVLTGPIAGGTILTIGVTDVGQVSSYAATVLQVTTPTYQLRALTGYSLKISQ